MASRLPLLADRLARALRTGDGALDHLATAEPANRRDALLTALTIQDLHLAPLEQLGDLARWQHHPAIAVLKNRVEHDLLASLEEDDAAARWDLPDDAVAAMRAIAHVDLVPPVYDWLAEQASWDDLVAYLALEGGPDGGFDDLVALCQVGLSGEPKVELGRNYWDEMGNGDLSAVHTELHRQLSQAIDLPAVPRAEQPVEALERLALGGILATNRWLQPEMLGALGLLELQAGPRCRKVVVALKRLDAPADAFPFYVEHAEVDPRHGKAWLDNAITPYVAEHPEWADRVVRGARWRSLVNARFFEAMAHRFMPATETTAQAS
jgi:hypothetical protein